MRAVWLVVATGCSFSSGAISPTTDAFVALDAPIDAGTDCAITNGAQLDDAGKVVDGGGGLVPPIACTAATDSIVGIALRVSQGITGGGARSSLAIDLACAPVTIHPNHTASIGAVYTIEATGSGMAGWSPADLTPIAQCPTDSVMSGIEAHTGVANSIFVNVTITCAQIGDNGVPTGTIAQVYVVNSLSDQNNDHHVTCGTGDVVAQLGPYIGAGLDGVDVRCAPSSCAP